MSKEEFSPKVKWFAECMEKAKQTMEPEEFKKMCDTLLLFMKVVKEGH